MKTVYELGKIRGFFKLIIKSDMHNHFRNQLLILSEKGNKVGVKEGGGEGPFYCVQCHMNVYVIHGQVAYMYIL